MLLLFFQIAIAKSSCDFTTSVHLWGHRVETNQIFEYTPPPHFRLRVHVVCKMGVCIIRRVVLILYMHVHLMTCHFFPPLFLRVR